MMQTLATGKTRYSQAGFTLVELMVSLFVMGLVAGVVVLGVPQGKDPLAEEMEYFRGALRDVRDEAVLSGQVMGLNIDASGYRFVRQSRTGWIPYASKKTQGWPGGVLYSLSRNGSQIETGLNTQTEMPLLLFYPTGDYTPFELSLSNAQNSIALKGDGVKAPVVEQSRL